MIIVKANVVTKEGMRNDFVKAAAQCVLETRKEPGCISYEFLVSTEDDCAGAFIEQWQKMEDLSEHSKKEHYKKFKKDSRDVVAQPTVVKIFEATEKAL